MVYFSLAQLENHIHEVHVVRELLHDTHQEMIPEHDRVPKFGVGMDTVPPKATNAARFYLLLLTMFI